MDMYFTVKKKSPLNNCYTKFKYKFNITESDLVKETIFKLKFTLIALAVNEVIMTKMLLLIGGGVDGKRMDTILERNGP